MKKWGLGYWRADIIAVTLVLPDPQYSINGELYRTKALAIDGARKFASKHGYGIVALNIDTNRVQWVRRCRVEFDIEARISGKWELMTCETERREAKERLKEYRRNQPGYQYRIKRRRVKIDPDKRGGLNNAG